MNQSTAVEKEEQHQEEGMNSFKYYFEQYPYSFFSLKKGPAKFENKQRSLQKWTKEMPYSFEEKFWEFDIRFIEFAQYFHIMRASKVRKYIGYLILPLAMIISLLNTTEMWSLLVLYLSFLGFDSQALWLTDILLCNTLIVQIPKRFIKRKRPFEFSPPRAFKITNQRSSSFPSRVVVTSTTMVLGLFTSEFSEECPSWLTATLVTLLTYFVASFMRVHLGSCYPSDCIASFFLAIIVIVCSIITWQLSSFSSCRDCSTENSICYYEQGLGEQLIQLGSFQLKTLHFDGTIGYVLGGFFIFALFTVYPIEFWKKTPFLFANFLALYLFHYIMMCPTKQNNFQTSLDSSPSTINGTQYTFIYTFLVLLLGQSVIVSKLLGRRIGHLLAFLLRCLFFLCILFQVLAAQIVVRLLLTS